MNKVILSILFFLSLVSAWAQKKKADEFNFGFEQRSGGVLPDNWTQCGSGYSIRIDTVMRHGGRASIAIESLLKRGPNALGCVMTSFRGNYRAKEIEVRASMKLENISEGPIGLMVRVDGVSGFLGFENMQRKNIQGTADWKAYSVKIPFPPGTKTISVGASLAGKGKLWVDDMEVLLDGKPIQKAKILIEPTYKADKDRTFDHFSHMPDLVTTESGIENLVMLGKIWGFLKYYHPAIAAGEYNWDAELFRILPKVMASKDKDERNNILYNWISGLGKFGTKKTDDKPEGVIRNSPELSWIKTEMFGPELFALLNEVKQAKRGDKSYYVEKNFWKIGFKNERPYSSMRFDDAGFRLLCLYRYWNVIEYFFPYKDVIGEDWNGVLREYISRFAESNTDLKYKLTILSLIGRIHDSHANIWGGNQTLMNYNGNRFAPLDVEFVEDKFIVRGYRRKEDEGLPGIGIGDAIENVEGKSIEEIMRERLPYTPASNYLAQLRDLAMNLLRTNLSYLDIQYDDGKDKKALQMKTFNPNETYLQNKFQRKDTCYRLIASNIAYLYPGSFKSVYLQKFIPEILKTDGLIIDLRCYPLEPIFGLGDYLYPKPVKFAKFSYGSLEKPGQFTFGDANTIGKENPAYYKGKVVILINEMTQSQSEFTTMALRVAPRATVIGSTTAAADGDIIKFDLPGGISTTFSGYGVYYPDGRETQRVGITPDVEVKPTIKGVREGRDELLEKAIEIIRN